MKGIEAMKVVKAASPSRDSSSHHRQHSRLIFYNDFVAVAGVEGVSKDQVKQAAKQNQNVLQRIVTALAEIFNTRSSVR